MINSHCSQVRDCRVKESDLDSLTICASILNVRYLTKLHG